MEPVSRSTYGFCQGARGADGEAGAAEFAARIYMGAVKGGAYGRHFAPLLEA